MKESSGADLRVEAYYCVAERPRDDAEAEEVAQTRTNKVADGWMDVWTDGRTDEEAEEDKSPFFFSPGSLVEE